MHRAGPYYTKLRLSISGKKAWASLEKIIALMTENKQPDINAADTDSPNPALIIGIFIAIGSFILLTSTLNSVFSTFS